MTKPELPNRVPQMSDSEDCPPRLRVWLRQAWGHRLAFAATVRLLDRCVSRKSLAPAASLRQLHVQLNLPNQQSEPILHSPVVLTQGPKTKERHLLLFRDWLVIAKERTSKSYTFKQKLPLSDLKVVSCDKDEDGDFIISQGSAVLCMMASNPCVSGFPDEDTLPRPIQDILTILCLKGPSTEGIFRKAANEKARKELKEELNSGGLVDLKSLPVHLLAVVFKDFLRSIPLKLLSCSLFEEWMGALEKQSEDDRIEALKQVADKLPRPNLLLLKHLVSVLYLISKNSEVSRMDASNLAICIGPNVLSPENEHDLSFEARRDLNHKVKTLVEFLIDNCFEIFGENIPAHSSVASDDSLEHTDSSDVSTLQNDSAYDSNDPDPDVDASSAMGSPGRQPPVPSDPAAGSEPRGPRHTWEPIVSSVARLRGSLGQADRRYSDPSVASSRGCLDGWRAEPTLARSEDDVTGSRAASLHAAEDAEDPFSEEVFPAAEGRGLRPPDLGLQNLAQGLVAPRGPARQAASTGSLEAYSDSSPLASPSGPKRNFFARHQSFTRAEKSKPNREIKKHSMSFSFAAHKKALSKTPSSVAAKCKGLPRDHAKNGFQKESQLAGRIVQEDLTDIHSQTALALNSGSSALSGEAVGQRGPGSPPSYEEALRHQAWDLAAPGGQTVGSMRARMLSLDAGLPPPPRSQAQPWPGREAWEQSRTVCASVATVGQVTVTGRPELQRLRLLSESRQNKQELVAQRCSQPVFEADQLRLAKESYV